MDFWDNLFNVEDQSIKSWVTKGFFIGLLCGSIGAVAALV